MHRNDIRNSTPAGVALSENSAAASAIPDSNNQFGIGYGIVSALQSLFHVHGYWTRDEQQVGMPRASYKFDPDAWNVWFGSLDQDRYSSPRQVETD